MTKKKLACKQCREAKRKCEVYNQSTCGSCFSRQKDCEPQVIIPKKRKKACLKPPPKVQEEQSNSIQPILPQPFGLHSVTNTLSETEPHCYSSLSTTELLGVSTTNTSLANATSGLSSEHSDTLSLESFYNGLFKYISGMLEISTEEAGSQHALSPRMMQTYVMLYWANFHPQLPILHKPTFSESTCPKFLLVVIICLGAHFSGDNYSRKLANLLAWEIRYELVKEADSSPDNNLCTFQGLVLLEVFEKRYSTQQLCNRSRAQRGNILRRMESFGFLEEDLIRQSVNPNGIPETWNIWVATEATRRVVFAAVFMDNIDTVQIDPTGQVQSQEIKLRLPCAENIWAAPQDSWERRSEFSNDSAAVLYVGVFRNTLQSKPVQTSWFGRVVLMAELLAVLFGAERKSWFLLPFPQRIADMRKKWQELLPPILEFWKQDYNSVLEQSEDRIVFESQTILYHLAHMVTHVDIVDCQIYSGAWRLFGKSMTQQNRNHVEHRMRKWATTAEARNATLHATRLLYHIFAGDHKHLEGQFEAKSSYSMLEDHHIYRPWALHLATLIVWSYSFALDGPMEQSEMEPTHEALSRDFVQYLSNVGGAGLDKELTETPTQSACLGLLLVMKDMFKESRVEFLQQAGDELAECLKKSGYNG